MRYNLVAGTANDMFNEYSLYTSPTLYDKLETYTGSYQEILPMPSGGGKTGKGSLATPVITNISPLSISAGTDSIITITGTDFESARGSGSVQFKNADNGGSSGGARIYPYHYISWSDTQIKVRVPGQAGTGKIVATNNSASGVTSADTVKITFAQLNVVFDTLVGIRLPNHRDNNGSGGYTWRMNPKFANKIPAKQAFFRALKAGAAARL